MTADEAQQTQAAEVELDPIRRRKAPETYARFVGVTLDVHDLRQIEHEMTRIAPVSITSSHFTRSASSVEDLLSLDTDHLTEFDMVSANYRTDHGEPERISLSITPSGISLHTSEDQRSLGAFSTIRSILKERQRPAWRRWLRENVMGYVGMFLVMVPLVLLAAGTPEPLLLVVMLVGLGFVAIQWRLIKSSPDALVYLVAREDRPGFWRRNQDTIVLDAGKVVFGALIGWALAHFLG